MLSTLDVILSDISSGHRKAAGFCSIDKQMSTWKSTSCLWDLHNGNIRSLNVKCTSVIQVNYWSFVAQKKHHCFVECMNYISFILHILFCHCELNSVIGLWFWDFVSKHFRTLMCTTITLVNPILNTDRYGIVLYL